MAPGFQRSVLIWTAVGSAGFLLLPWYAVADGLLGFGSPARMLAERDLAPAIVQSARFGRPWLLPPGVVLLAALTAQVLRPRARGRTMMILGAAGFLYTLGQGFGIGLSQPGMGAGALIVLASFLFLFSTGLAARGYFRGEGFVAGAVVSVTVLVGLFTFFPVVRMLISAVYTDGGAISAAAFLERLSTAKIWRLDCLTGGGRCGVAWNTLLLALLTATATTALGLAFALVVTRTGFAAKRLLRVLTVLPIITPPFVIGLGLILLFGRSGLLNQLVEWLFSVPPSR